MHYDKKKKGDKPEEDAPDKEKPTDLPFSETKKDSPPRIFDAIRKTRNLVAALS